MAEGSAASGIRRALTCEALEGKQFDRTRSISMRVLGEQKSSMLYGNLINMYECARISSEKG